MSLSGQIGQYEIVEILGSGAMGDVYRATDSKMFGRVVALKILSERLSQNEHACARFKREVEVASSLTHPHIVTIHDRGEHEGRPYFVMEYLEGTDLTQLIKDHGSRTVEQRLEMARQIADALQFAHGHNVVHRDVKPSNIMLTHAGGQEQTKLVDFGIAHVERSSLTRATTQPGTFSYMSPEQLKNDALDHRSDLFSLGIVLYELFTGSHPFDAPSEALITTRILRDEPEPARNRNPEVPAALDSLVLKLLEKEPMQRPQTAAEVTDALRQILRKLQTRGVATDPSEYSNLDDLTRQMVENLLTWARQKEAEGSLDEALKAYEKAHQLAPDSERLKLKLPRLKHRIESDKKLREFLDRARAAIEGGRSGEAREHWRDAWILSPDSEEVAALDREIETAERTTPEDRERKEFVESHIRQVEEALDAGRTDLARGPLVEILKRYPNETLAGLMLDRLMVITASGIPYADYRTALRDAKLALGLGRYAEARAACGLAQEIWRGDEEVLSLEREIGSRVQAEVAALVARIEGLIQASEEPGQDEARALDGVRAALDALAKARDLGADPDWLHAAEEQARRRKNELEERRRTREQEEREREEQRRKIVSSFLLRGRNLNDEAESLRRRGLAEGDRAIEAFQQARTAYSKVLEEDAENVEALDAIRRIDAARSALQKEIDADRTRQREATGLVAAARGALERARAGAEGDEDARRGSLDLVAEGLRAAGQALTLVPESGEALKLRQDLEAVGKTVREEAARREAARREMLGRRTAAIEAAVADGRKLLARMEPLVSGDPDDLAMAEEVGLAAEAAYKKALALDPEHVEATEALKVLTSYIDHARSEARRRREESEHLAREGAERLRAETRRAKIEGARRALAAGDAALGASAEDVRSAVEALEASAVGLRDALREHPADTEAAALEERRGALLSGLRERLRQLEKDEDERKRKDRDAAEASVRKQRAAGVAAAIATAGDSLGQARSLAGKASAEGDRILALLERARASIREASELDRGNGGAARLAESLESFASEVAPAIEKGRRQAALNGVRERIEKARGLAGSGKHKDAVAILSALDRECRPYEWLHDAMPEIQRLKSASEAELGRGRRKLAIAGGAGAVILVAAAAGIALLSRGGGGRTPVVATPPSVAENSHAAERRAETPPFEKAKTSPSPAPRSSDLESRTVTEPGPRTPPPAPPPRGKPATTERRAAVPANPVPAKPPPIQPPTSPPAPPASTLPASPAPSAGNAAGAPSVERVPAAVAGGRFEGGVRLDGKEAEAGCTIELQNITAQKTVRVVTTAGGRFSMDVDLNQRYQVVRLTAADGRTSYVPINRNPRAINVPGAVEWNLSFTKAR